MAEESTSETPPEQSIAHPKCFSKFELQSYMEPIFEGGWDGLTGSSSLPLPPKRVVKESDPCVGTWNQDLTPKSLKRTSEGEIKPLSPNAGIDPAIGDIYEACGIICANQDAVEARQVSDYNKSYARKITRHEIIKWMKAGTNGEIVAKEEEDQLSGFLGMELFLQWPRAIF
ncbi:hypothetical protein FOXYSP1_07107 [Fusarium oxysporum f. sp. phaseoli]